VVSVLALVLIGWAAGAIVVSAKARRWPAACKPRPSIPKETPQPSPRRTLHPTQPTPHTRYRGYLGHGLYVYLLLTLPSRTWPAQTRPRCLVLALSKSINPSPFHAHASRKSLFTLSTAARYVKKASALPSTPSITRSALPPLHRPPPPFVHSALNHHLRNPSDLHCSRPRPRSWPLPGYSGSRSFALSNAPAPAHCGPQEVRISC